MSYDSDVALLGTGVAPLIAANHFLQQGKSVLLLNPDWDFFLEDSELPLDPLLQRFPSRQRLHQGSPEHAMQVLRPYFPGAIEFWSPHSTHSSGFHDTTAPHVRQRGRLWISESEFSNLNKNQLWNWEQLEDFYVETSDANFNPKILEGLPAVKKFPGFSSRSENFRGLLLPKLCDVDVVRFRNGLLEYVRERLGSERVICAASQIEWMPDGIRFYYKGALHNAKLSHGMLAYWTPRLTSWVAAQAKKNEIKPKLPLGVRLWEQWILHSREISDPDVVGMYNDMVVWADLEGRPPANQRAEHRLSVLRASSLLPLSDMHLPQGGLSWASGESFNSLSQLCHDFLKWDRFSVAALKSRALFDWPADESSWLISHQSPQIRVIPACDGPLVSVVQSARSSCDHFS